MLLGGPARAPGGGGGVLRGATSGILHRRRASLAPLIWVGVILRLRQGRRTLPPDPHLRPNGTRHLMLRASVPPALVQFYRAPPAPPPPPPPASSHSTAS